MGDIVRDSYDKSLGQKKVVFQQQKPLLNYELNLAQDLLNNHNIDLTKFSLGNNYYGESFLVKKGTLNNEVFIKKGTFYHNGLALDLTTDKRLSVPVAPGSGSRIDYVYVEYSVNQVDSPADPLIGFVTTREDRLSFDVKVSQGAYPSLTPEQIVFNSTDNSISLTNGSFPDWMRIPNTQITTSSPNNAGSPFLTVQSSPDPKKIILNETLSDEILHDVRFRQYTITLEIPKEYRATSNNFFVIALLNRVAGINTVDSIADFRNSAVYNYVEKGCDVYDAGGLNIGVNEGSLYVSENSHFIEDTQPNLALTDDSLNYVSVSVSGNVEVSTSKPNDFHVMLAEVTTQSGSIYHIEDVREYTPIAYNNIFGNNGGSGETDFPSMVHAFKAGENILGNDAVYLSSSNTIKRSDCISSSKLPVIGLAVDDIAAGNIDYVVTFGIIEESSWNWTVGESIFLGPSPGTIIGSSDVSTFVSDQQYVHRIGVAISPEKIFVKPELMYIKKDSSAEVPLVTMRDSGELEVMGPNDRLSADRLSPLAIQINDNTQTFQILSGRYYVAGNESIDYPGDLINMGTSGTTYKTKAIPPNFYNKAFFTLDDGGVLHMYEGIPSASEANVQYPNVPEDELPIGVITFQDDSNGLDGSIIPLNSLSLEDKRPWLNLGPIDEVSFKAIYRDDTNIYISKGEGWFNKQYVRMSDYQIIPVNTVDDDYFVYLNLNNTTGSGVETIANTSSFDILTLSPDQVDLRKLVPLAKWSVVGGVVSKISFKTFNSKFWEFRDSEYSGEQIFPNLSSSQNLFNVTNYNFIDQDYLRVTINGIEVYESKDYVKDGNTNTVTFNYDVLTGAEVRIRKV